MPYTPSNQEEEDLLIMYCPYSNGNISARQNILRPSHVPQMKNKDNTLERRQPHDHIVSSNRSNRRAFQLLRHWENSDLSHGWTIFLQSKRPIDCTTMLTCRNGRWFHAVHGEKTIPKPIRSPNSRRSIYFQLTRKEFFKDPSSETYGSPTVYKKMCRIDYKTFAEL